MSALDPSTAEGLAAILTVAQSAAREAGALVQTGFRRRPAAHHKGAVDLVTEYDLRSEELLRARLASALPFAIVGEEAGGSAREDEPVFFIDPIDGTTNYVHGHPFWCVSIGLVVADRPVLGVVVAPTLGLEWSGWTAPTGERRSSRRAHGATHTTEPAHEPCQVSPSARFEDALLATGFPYDRRTSPDNNFDAFVAIKRQCQAVRRCGSAALDLCLVADGTYEGYWERKLNPWDLAGGTAILTAAGGRVTNFDGGDDFIATGHVVATNGAIHQTLLEALALVAASASSFPAAPAR